MALMRRRVYDMAGVLGKQIKVTTLGPCGPRPSLSCGSVLRTFRRAVRLDEPCRHCPGVMNTADRLSCKSANV